MAPTGSSTLSLRSTKNDGLDDEDAGDDADDRRRPRVDEGARGGDGHEAGEHAVGHHARVGLAGPLHDPEHRRRSAPKAPAIAVLAATTANWTSVAAKVEAALKPNQPNSRMNVPSIAIGMWWPGMRARLAVLVELADAGPEHDGAGEAGDAADGVHDAGAGEVDVADARGSCVLPSLASQPPPQVQAPNSG